MSNKKRVKAQHPKAKASRCYSGDEPWIVSEPFMEGSHVLGTGKTAALAWRDAARSITPKSNKSIRAFIDRLIAWSSRSTKPIEVQATANTVRKFARKRNGAYRYRDRVIVPLRPVRRRSDVDFF